ncbi:hypothetical protein [Acetobacter cerevisiae]|uniref:hypothetical protein n=1 Tax=Acetobacter cerevisiae TaxID=178900 RepID=UPI00046166B3|nr:hypothetical protein [Acetobacter cerevisiae]KDE21360.1 hypothetical protein AZ09_00735 [Acetobacter aceti 1023]
MFEESEKFIRLRKIFEEDGSELRKQMIYAGLILTIFERFKRYIIDQLECFFSSDLQIRDGKIIPKRGEKFTELIKEDSKKTGKKPSPFRTALRWFYDSNAIDEHDFNEVQRLYKIRNDIGHELLLVLADDQKNPITLYDVIFCFSIYLKIVRWWVKEIELSTDPYMTQEKYESIDSDGIESPDTVFLREIMEKALSDNSEWIFIKKNIPK